MVKFTVVTKRSTSGPEKVTVTVDKIIIQPQCAVITKDDNVILVSPWENLLFIVEDSAIFPDKSGKPEIDSEVL